MYTAKNTAISPDFLSWKYCGKAQFLHSCGRFARNYAETVPFRKISTTGNQVKLRYFSQWYLQSDKRYKIYQKHDFTWSKDATRTPEKSKMESFATIKPLSIAANLSITCGVLATSLWSVYFHLLHELKMGFHGPDKIWFPVSYFVFIFMNMCSLF